ncbi:MAG: hypothetical protein VKJ46_12605, partial [Leptolyngbyaceae bacterium]|nr:hypothetical protein [Leptolyngbyaceae bacterium]
FLLNLYILRKTVLSLQTITIPAQTGQAPVGLIVVLHGWGASAEDIAPLVPPLNLPQYQFMMPSGPFPHPYAPEGRMWYGFPANYSFQSQYDFDSREDLATSRKLLREWLAGLADSTGIPLSRTILAGFSQGGAMTLDVGHNLPVAGLMVLSGYLHAAISPEPGSSPPVLMVHGRQDSVVPLGAAQQARDSLIAAGMNVNYHELNMDHEIRLEVLDRMGEFIATVFR